MVNSYSSPATVLASRDTKPGWYKTHNKLAKTTLSIWCETLLISDSIVSGLARYKQIQNKYFSNTLNLGIVGDSTQNVLWRIRNTRMVDSNFVVVHCGTNNIDFHQPEDIVDALLLIGEKVHIYNPKVKVISSGILPPRIKLYPFQ